MGAGVGGQTGNNGRMFIALKPWDQRVGGSAQDYIARLRPKFAAVSGGKAFLQAAQDIRVGGTLTKTEFQYTLQDADFDELFYLGVQRSWRSCRPCRCCAMSPATSRPAVPPSR